MKCTGVNPVDGGGGLKLLWTVPHLNWHQSGWFHPKTKHQALQHTDRCIQLNTYTYKKQKQKAPQCTSGLRQTQDSTKIHFILKSLCHCELNESITLIAAVSSRH